MCFYARSMTDSSNSPAPQTAPVLTYLATITAYVDTPIELGRMRDGARRIVPITGGTIEGPELRGHILPGGADYQLLRSETATELVAKYAFETDDGDRVSVENLGVRAGSAEDIAALVAGRPVPQERVYFRSTPKVWASGSRWAWLEDRILVGAGVRHPDSVVLDVFIVD